MRRRALWAVIGIGTAAAAAVVAYWMSLRGLPRPGDIAEIRRSVAPRLEGELRAAGLALGNAVFLRIFKETNELEVWVRKDGPYRKFRTYAICAYSGALGPKLKEGDGQSPEGFYRVSLASLNPKSSYHLSFNLGFPNAFDRAHGRTGSFLMVHGRCVSIGCYAMTDPTIEEIYVMVEASLQGARGSIVPVHIFPFRMSAENMRRHAASPWLAFWENLKDAYDVFEASRIPPKVTVSAGRYVAAR
ncbi:MAG: murein L,D-transpeptidase family protein [Hyphomicrobiaceae bacterium]